MRTFTAVLLVATLFAGVVVDARSLSQAPSSTCTSCEEFVTLGEAYLNEPETQAAIVGEVKKACVGAGKEAPECEMLLEAGMQWVLNYVNTEGTPVAACTAAGLCAAAPKNKNNKAHLFASPALSAAITQGAAGAAAPPGGPDCLKCKFAVETMHTAITSNDTVAELLTQGAAMCAKYAAAFDMDAECAALVKTYGPELIKSIGDKLADPAAVCASIGMCTAAAAEKNEETEETEETETPQLAASSDEAEEKLAGFKRTGKSFARGAKNLLKKMRVVQAMQASQIKAQNI